jgi:hypothetical protein
LGLESQSTQVSHSTCLFFSLLFSPPPFVSTLFVLESYETLLLFPENAIIGAAFCNFLPAAETVANRIIIDSVHFSGNVPRQLRALICTQLGSWVSRSEQFYTKFEHNHF